jgi:hypothetical protein
LRLRLRLRLRNEKIETSIINFEEYQEITL